jgi:hypothetical protein
MPVAIRKVAIAEGALATLLDALRQLHTAAGEPTVREIAKRVDGQISRDTVHRVLTAARVPRWRNLEIIVGALDGDVSRFQRLWVAARAEEDQAGG